VGRLFATLDSSGMSQPAAIQVTIIISKELRILYRIRAASIYHGCMGKHLVWMLWSLLVPTGGLQSISWKSCCRFDGRKPAICWECLWECLWDYMDQNPMPHPMRFERTRGNPTALAGRRLNHSATGGLQSISWKSCCRFDGRKPAICWKCLWECLWDYMDQNPMPHPMRFERTRGNPTALAGRRLNHSATGAQQSASSRLLLKLS
ncbi:hypothetical protein VOLCADRAFT_101193, partial [Volvox carteri f. nagariensis]